MFLHFWETDTNVVIFPIIRKSANKKTIVLKPNLQQIFSVSYYAVINVFGI
jgi:hypothetical protein